MTVTRAAVVLSVALCVLAASAGAASARHFPTGTAAVLTGGHTDAAQDSDGDGVADRVLMRVPVRVNTGGTFVVTGTLKWTGGSGAVTSVTAALAAGDHHVSLVFPGDFLDNRDVEEPYTVNVTLSASGQTGLLDWYEYRTNAYPSGTFEPAVISFTRDPVVYPVDENGDGRPDVLRIDAPVFTRRDGAYLFNLTVREILSNRVLPGNFDVVASPPLGGSMVTVPIPRTSIRLDYSGAYSVDLRLFDVTTPGLRLPLDVATTTTEGYRMSAFAADGPPRLGGVRAPPPSGAGGVSVHGLTVASHVLAEGQFVFHAILTDAASGNEARATTGVARYATSDDVSVHLASAAAAAVLRGSDAPTVYAFLRDEGSLVVGGARVELPPSPRVTITFDGEGDVLPGDASSFRAVPERLANDDPGAYEWDLGDGFKRGGSVVDREFTRSGNYSMSVRLTNAYGIDAVTSRDVTVGVDRAPIVEYHPPWRVSEGERATLEVDAWDPNGRPLAIVLESAPPGLTAEGLVLTWTPPFDSERSMTARMYVSDGRLDTRLDLPIHVANVPAPPALRLKGAAPLSTHYEATLGVPFTLDLEGYDPEGAVVVIAAETLPPGARLDNGVLTWPNPTAGDYFVVLHGIVGSRTTTASFTVSVTSGGDDGGGGDGSDGGDGLAGAERQGIPSPSFAVLLVTLGLVAFARAAVVRRPR